MKQLYALICFFIVISCNSVSYSQGLSAGFFSGINISDIHGNSYSGKWKFKPGPVQGVFVDFNPSRIFGFSTGMNYSTIYYEHKFYTYGELIYYGLSSSSFYPGTHYYPNEVMDFSFITIPAQLKLTIPSKPSLNLSTGVFWSFLQDQNLNSNYYYYEAQKRDFGFIYSAGLSYPFSKDFDILLRVRYLAGRKNFFENRNYRHGSIDFNLGVTFNGFLGGADDDSGLPVRTDSSQSKLHLIYFGGTDLSWNSPGNSPGNYSVSLGPSAGFRLDIPVGRKTEFRTGLSFEQTGYSLRDSSDIFYGYNIEDGAEYLVDTKTTIDYIEIPASLKINIGRSNTFYISTGPYLTIKLNARSTGEAFSNEENSSMYRRIRTVVYDDLERLIKDNDSGWSFGAGITIPVFTKYHAEFGSQYKLGFRDVFDATYFSGTNQYDNLKTVIRNRTLSFHIGLKIPVHN